VTRAYYASIVVSSTLFLFYGVACLFFAGMRRDFERFGLSRLRTLVGTLEVLGALGLIVGQLWPPLVPLSAGGLAWQGPSRDSPCLCDSVAGFSVTRSPWNDFCHGLLAMMMFVGVATRTAWRSA